MKRRIVFMVTLVGFGLSWVALAQDHPALKQDVLKLLPDQLGKTNATATAEYFSGDKLFQYMNGGAEVYLAYGFLDIGVRPYGEGTQKVFVEIYRMQSSLEAFGIHAFFTRGQEVQLEKTQARFSPGVLSFAKENLYIKIIAQSVADETQERLKAIGIDLDKRLTGRYQVPKPLESLPKGAILGSVRYLPNLKTGQLVWFEGEAEALWSHPGEAFTAAYANEDDTQIQITWVSYSDAKAAMTGCQALSKKLGLYPDASEGRKEGTHLDFNCSAFGKNTEATFSALRAHGNRLYWVHGANSAAEALEWMKKIK